MIDRSAPEQALLIELDLHGIGTDRDVATRPVLSQPTVRIHSPLMDQAPRTAEMRPAAPTIPLPPLSTFISPLLWAIVPAVPVFLRVGWEAAVVVAVVALLIREARLRATRSSLSFADGFLAYAGDNRWPRGVQEDDDVHWNWSAGRASSGQHAGS
jgi:hypothetical protein